jgi:endo-1,4-beta-xylanase
VSYLNQFSNQMPARIGGNYYIRYLHPSEYSFTFGQADELVSFAASNGMAMHGHTLIWHADYQLPAFMKNYSGDFAAMLKNHVQTIVSHFQGKVVS